MSHLRTASQRVIDAVRAAGIRVTEDPRSLNPPAVMVQIEDTMRMSTGRVTVNLTLALVAPGPANLDARRKLDDLIGQLTPALDAAGLPWTSGRMTVLDHPASGEPLYTYELTLTLTTEV